MSLGGWRWQNQPRMDLYQMVLITQNLDVVIIIVNSITKKEELLPTLLEMG